MDYNNPSNHFVKLEYRYLQKLSLPAAVLLCELMGKKRYYDNKEWFPASVPDIEARLHIERRSQARYLKELKNAGFIAVKRIGNITNRFIAVLPAAYALTEDSSAIAPSRNAYLSGQLLERANVSAAVTDDCSAVTGDFAVEAAKTGVSAAETGGSAAETGGSAAKTGVFAAATGDSAAATGVSAAETGVFAAATGDSAVTTGVSAAKTGVSAAETGVSAAETGDSAAATGVSAAATGVFAAETGVSAAETGVSAAETGVSAAETGVFAAATGDDGRPSAEADMAAALVLDEMTVGEGKGVRLPWESRETDVSAKDVGSDRRGTSVSAKDVGSDRRGTSEPVENVCGNPVERLWIRDDACGKAAHGDGTDRRGTSAPVEKGCGNPVGKLWIRENDGGKKSSGGDDVSFLPFGSDKLSREKTDSVLPRRDKNGLSYITGEKKQENSRRKGGERRASPPPETKASFVKPTEKEVAAYITEKGYTLSAAKFIAYYSANGWHFGKTLMNDWKSAVDYWHTLDKDKAPPQEDRPIESGFDTKTAFEAACRRSYQQMLEEEEEEKRRLGQT